MTQDHIDDFSDTLDREKRGYLICVHGGKGKPGAHVRFELENWPELSDCEIRSESKAHSLLLAIACALSQDGEKFEVIKIK